MQVNVTTDWIAEELRIRPTTSICSITFNEKVVNIMENRSRSYNAKTHLTRLSLPKQVVEKMVKAMEDTTPPSPKLIELIRKHRLPHRAQGRASQL